MGYELIDGEWVEVKDVIAWIQRVLPPTTEETSPAESKQVDQETDRD